MSPRRQRPDNPMGLGEFAAVLNQKRARAVAEACSYAETIGLATLDEERLKERIRDVINNFADRVAATLPRLDPGGDTAEILELVGEIHEQIVGADGGD